MAHQNLGDTGTVGFQCSSVLFCDWPGQSEYYPGQGLYSSGFFLYILEYGIEEKWDCPTVQTQSSSYYEHLLSARYNASKNTEEAKGVALENPQKSCKNPGVAEHVCKSSAGDKEIGRSLEFTDQQV